MKKMDIEPSTGTTQVSSEIYEASENRENSAGLFAAIIETKKRVTHWPEGTPFIGECLSSRHPTLHGRVLVRWDAPGGQRIEEWVLTLQGLSIRSNDRLLLQMAAGMNEPIVIGVIDGFLPRPEPERIVGSQLILKKDEILKVTTEDNQPLVEIIQDSHGPIVRLFQAETRIEFQGKLSIAATELELKAKQGKVLIEASDDIKLVGEIINLN